MTAYPFRHAYLQLFEYRASRATELLEVNHASTNTRLINWKERSMRHDEKLRKLR